MNAELIRLPQIDQISLLEPSGSGASDTHENSMSSAEEDRKEEVRRGKRTVRTTEMDV